MFTCIKREVKVEATSFDNVILNIAPFWFSLNLLRLSVSVYRKGYREKGERDNLDPSINIGDRDSKKNNSSLDTGIANSRVDNLSPGTGRTDGGVNDLKICIADGVRKANNSGPGIGIIDRNKAADNFSPGIGIIDRDKAFGKFI